MPRCKRCDYLGPVVELRRLPRVLDAPQRWHCRDRSACKRRASLDEHDRKYGVPEHQKC